MKLQEKYNHLFKDVENRKKQHRAYKNQERKLKLVVCDILKEEINHRNLAVSNAIYGRQSKLLNEKENLFTDLEKGIFFGFGLILSSLVCSYVLTILGL